MPQQPDFDFYVKVVVARAMSLLRYMEVLLLGAVFGLCLEYCAMRRLT